MQFDKFTTKAQEAVREAQTLARERSHQELDGEHLLLALARQTDSLIPSLLQKMGVGLSQLAGELEEILARHPGQAVLVVSHHVVNRTYLAGILGLPLKRAKQVALDNCGVSVVVREGTKMRVATLNAAFHLDAA